MILVNKNYTINLEGALASQMSNAKLERTTVTIDNSNHEKILLLKERLLFLMDF